MTSEEAATLLARGEATAQKGGNSSNQVENESANAVLDTLIDLSSHKIICKPTRESAIADSAATSSCCPSRAKLASTGRVSTKSFEVPTGQVAKAGEERMLPHNLREPANICHEVPAMQQDTLLSVPKLVDAGYTPLLTKDGIEVYNTSDIKFVVSRDAVLRGWREESGLWRIPLEEEITQTNVQNTNTQTVVTCKAPTELLRKAKNNEEFMCNLYELRKQPEIVRFLHAAAGFPTKRTWLKAIRKGFYSSWPGLTAKTVEKYFPESEETQKGHMRSIKAGIRSTKKPIQQSMQEGTPIEEEEEVPRNKKMKQLAVRVVNMADFFKETIDSDQTGRFPFRSSRGYQYVMIIAESDSDAIFYEPVRNKEAGSLVKAWTNVIKRLNKSGVFPKHQTLDNEISKEWKEAIANEQMTYELAPPGGHAKRAEKAIQIAKDHFISILCGTSKSFPMHLWDRLLPQAEKTVNMLRPARVAPNVSADAYLNGQHDFNAHPLAPVGMECEIHLKPGARDTWSEHSASGWNLGTSEEHYRCYDVFVEKTKGTRTGNTVFFKHKYLTMPTVTSGDALLRAAVDLKDAIEKNVSKTMQTDEAIKTLMQIFKSKAAQEKDPMVQLRNDMKTAASQRANTEANEVLQTSEGAPQQRVVSPEPMPDLVPRTQPDYDSDDETAEPIISYPEHEDWEDLDCPSQRTRSQTQTRSITQECIMATVEMSTTRVNARMAAQRKYPRQLLMEMASAVLDVDTGEMLEYRHLMKNPKYRQPWGHSFGNEVGRLAQGMPGRVKGTDTMRFVEMCEIPSERRKNITYARIVCNHRPQKEEVNRTRIAVGGNLINCPFDCETPTADMITVKMLLNSVISTPHARWMTLDIKNFYLNTPMERKEYMRMELKNFPDDVIEHYNLRDMEKDGKVYVEISKGMYGLPQAGIIAQELLEKRLLKHQYKQSEHTPGLWTHKWRPICFSLIVDDFGVKYVGKEHAEHLIMALGDYDVEVDWKGNKYGGIDLDFDYEKRKVHLSMLGYVPKACKRFQHMMPKTKQSSPYPSVKPNYGAKVQYAKEADQSRILNKEEKTFVQQVVGTFLFYGRAIDSTMLMPLSAIASMQAEPTEETLERVKQFLDYAASNPDAILTYSASNMVLAIHSDASYLSEPKAKSRVGGHFFMSKDVEVPPNNGAVHNIAKLIKAVMSSAAEAELGGLYINAREAVPMRKTLEELGHKQPRTPMQTDNSTALGVVLNKIQPKRTKAMDMRFHWLRCRDSQGQFRYYWMPGVKNWADYWTKHHSAQHHRDMRPEFLTNQKVLHALRASLERCPVAAAAA